MGTSSLFLSSPARERYEREVVVRTREFQAPTGLQLARARHCVLQEFYDGTLRQKGFVIRSQHRGLTQGILPLASASKLIQMP